MHSGIQTTLLIFATLPLFNVLQVYPSIVISFQPHSLAYIRYPISYPISYIRYPISYPISYILYPLSYIMSLSLNGFWSRSIIGRAGHQNSSNYFLFLFNP